MSTTLFEDSIIQAKAMGIKGAALHTIGEPLVYPKMTELVEIAENHNFSLRARSNGVLTKKIKATERIKMKCHDFIFKSSFNSIIVQPFRL